MNILLLTAKNYELITIETVLSNSDCKIVCCFSDKNNEDYKWHGIIITSHNSTYLIALVSLSASIHYFCTSNNGFIRNMLFFVW